MVQINPENYLELAEEYKQLERAKEQLDQQVYGETASYNSSQEQNLVQWQLDLTEEFSKIEHRLKGEIEFVNKETGESDWKTNPDPEAKPFNNFGTQLIMSILSFYLNRNTILSNYAEDMINWKVKDFGERVADLIFNKYDSMMVTIDIEKEMEKITGHKIVKLKTGEYAISL